MDNDTSNAGNGTPETLTNVITRLYKIVNEIENKVYGPKPKSETKPVETTARSLVAQSIRDIKSINLRLSELSTNLNL